MRHGISVGFRAGQQKIQVFLVLLLLRVNDVAFSLVCDVRGFSSFGFTRPLDLPSRTPWSGVLTCKPIMIIQVVFRATWHYDGKILELLCNGGRSGETMVTLCLAFLGKQRRMTMNDNCSRIHLGSLIGSKKGQKIVLLPSAAGHVTLGDIFTSSTWSASSPLLSR